MMPARILRWKGGCAGDMLMRAMHLCGYRLANVRYQADIDQQGRVMLHDSLAPVGDTGLERMAQDQHHQARINLDQLIEDIRALEDVWIKSHYYVAAFDDITTDITLAAASLPFAAAANVYKTNILHTQVFHPLAHRVRDPDTRIKLALYAVARDGLATASTATAKISVTDLLQGWDQLCAKCQQVDIHVGVKARQFYEDWHQQNQRYLPGHRYLRMIETHDYDYERNDLSMPERYALLALSGAKFQLLT